MDKVVNKTVNVLTRFGERLGFGTEDEDYSLERSGSGFMFPIAKPQPRRPLDKKKQKDTNYLPNRRDVIYRDARKFSSDNLAASPSSGSFSNYRQNPMGNGFAAGMNRPPYGTGIGAPLSYGNTPNYDVYSGGYPDPSSSMAYGSIPGSVGYSPDYYIAERRQVELVPAPPPRVIQQQVPYPVPVDRPVPQPYPVEVSRPFPVDRPVPVPVPIHVPVDRPVAVPVPVPVPSPPPPPVCVPYPVAVPTPVPCYVPVGVPVPSPPPSPVMFEQSVTHTQRWVTGSPAMMNQQNYSTNTPIMMNQLQYSNNTPAMMNQQQYSTGSPAMFMNPYGSYGNGSFSR